MKRKRLKKPVKRIVAFVLLIVLALFISGCFKEKPLEQPWAQTYYTFIKEHLETEEEKLFEASDEIAFVDVQGQDTPVMLHHNPSTQTTNVFYIDDNETVKAIRHEKAGDIKHLYEIEEGKYNWYYHFDEGDSDIYIELPELIEYDKTQSDENIEFTFDEDDEISKEPIESVTDKDGNEHLITDFENTYIETGLDEEIFAPIGNPEQDDFRDHMQEVADSYTDEEELIHDEVKNHVAEKEIELEEKKQEIKEVKEENKRIEEEKKKAEEEAKRKAEEEKRQQEAAAAGIQIAGVTIKYGLYADSVGGVTLQPNGVCHIKTNLWGFDPIDEDCTYTVEVQRYEEFVGAPVVEKPFVKINTSKGSLAYVYENDSFHDQQQGFKYSY